VYFLLHKSLCTDYMFGVTTSIGLTRRDKLVGRVGKYVGGGRDFPHIPRGPQPPV